MAAELISGFRERPSLHVELISWRPEGRQTPLKNIVFDRHRPK
jgi:hypothetical protein